MPMFRRPMLVLAAVALAVLLAGAMVAMGVSIWKNLFM